MRTYTPKPGDIDRKWYIVDATDVVLGRLDFVIVVNASKVALTGSKLRDKMSYHHSGYPGGLKATSYAELLASQPEKAIEQAVKGMIPRNKLGRQQIKRLKVYAGGEHPHVAQQPEPYELKKIAQ